jgi:hypothetical protein
VFSRLHFYDFCGSFGRKMIPGHSEEDTCSSASLFPGVRRSPVSFVFSFKILILAMQIGCVKLLNLSANHMQELKAKTVIGCIENDSFVKLQETLCETALALQPVAAIPLERKRVKEKEC